MERSPDGMNLEGYRPAGYRQAYHPVHGMANLSEADYLWLKEQDRKKPEGMLEASADFRDAVQTLFLDVAKALRIDRLVEWLNSFFTPTVKDIKLHRFQADILDRVAAKEGIEMLYMPRNMGKSTLQNAVDDMIRQESAHLDREMRYFLSKHGLPMDRAGIAAAGYEVITETVMPADPLGTTTYIFKLAKIVDRKRVEIKHNIKIV